MKKILVTGGAGYIGSHTVLELLERGHQVVVLDNLSNSSEESLRRVEKISGKSIAFYVGDLRDEELLDEIFGNNEIESVIHFAGLKAVGESVSMPLEYYHNNVGGTLALLRAMGRAGVKSIIFSSSATVYGEPERLPLDEDCRLSVTNPYGATKLIIENILKDLHRSDNEWNVTILRYFNPVGAHESGLIGKTRTGFPTIWFPSSPRLPSESFRKSESLGTISTHLTVPGSAITSMSLIWLWGTLRPWRGRRSRA